MPERFFQNQDGPKKQKERERIEPGKGKKEEKKAPSRGDRGDRPKRA